MPVDVHVEDEVEKSGTLAAEMCTEDEVTGASFLLQLPTHICCHKLVASHN